jgi:peptidoglycan hydrolase CwlO-like protein
MDLKSITGILPIATVAVASIFSYATLSATAQSNTDDIQDNEIRLERHETQIQELDREVISIKHKVERVEEVTSETKDDVKQILILMQQKS